MPTCLQFLIGRFPGFVSNVALQRVKLSGLKMVLWLFVSCLALPALTRAQEQKAAPQQPEQQKLPMVEPAETHLKVHIPPFIEASPHISGKWTTLPFMMPINPVHVAMMHTGKVLIIAGSGNDPNNHTLHAGVWDPKTDTMKTFLISYDMFCNGMVILPNGKPFVLGGTIQYDPFFGYQRTSLFDPATETFANGPNMSGGRWYPTGTVLGNGNVMVLSGLGTTGAMNTTVQIGNGVTWSPAGSAFGSVQLYPREHLLPSGKVFEDGANTDSQMYDPATHTWTFVANTKFGAGRDYGTSVLLPLKHSDGYKPKVMILGGDTGSPTDTTELIDLSVPNPQWAFGPKMVGARVQLNATILPNATVLVSGGSSKNEDPATGILEAQIYHPDTNTFTSGSKMEYARVYHSNTVLLPDATVLALGGNPERGTYEAHMEIYSPAYLFKPDGTPAPRPVIKTSPANIFYGTAFPVTSTEAGEIKSVVLVRAGAVTHAFDMDQRMVELVFRKGAGVLEVTAPPNGNVAPPGYYLLFVLNDAGVPSVAKFVHLGPRLKIVVPKVPPGKVLAQPK